jgi:Cas7 group CRISPR-associated protein Csh2
MSTIENRYDFVYLFDCQDGNPNGDPDSDNKPRIDPQTHQGLVTDVCLKRKIRDYVLCAKSITGAVEKGYDIFVLGGMSLEQRQKLAYDNLNGEIEWKGDKTSRGDIEKASQWMCGNFFDVRTFGTVMSTKEFNCGQVRGPVQITFARSVDKILPLDHTITRVAYTKEEKRERLERTLNQKRQDHEAQKESLQRTQATNARELQNLTKLRIRDLLSDEEYMKERQELERAQIGFTQKLDALAKRDARFEPSQRIVSFNSCLVDRYMKGNLQRKRIILSTVGSNLVLKNKELSIDVRKPFRRWADSTDISDLRAFVRDIRTFVADDNAELAALMQNIQEVMDG